MVSVAEHTLKEVDGCCGWWSRPLYRSGRTPYRGAAAEREDTGDPGHQQDRHHKRIRMRFWNLSPHTRMYAALRDRSGVGAEG